MVSRSVLIDTSAYAHFRRGHEPVVDCLAEAERVFLSAVSLGELEAGFALGSRSRDNLMVLDAFLRESFVGIILVNHEVARRYGRLFAALRKAGTPIPTNDIWIAASALDVGAHVVTYDSAFDCIPGLACTVMAPPPAEG